MEGRSEQDLCVWSVQYCVWLGGDDPSLSGSLVSVERWLL